MSTMSGVGPSPVEPSRSKAGGAAIEAGDPAVDPRLFRRCLGQYGTGVAIITTEMDGQRGAITVNSFASVSLDPPLVLWSIGHTSRSTPLFKRSRFFAVNVLASTQMAVSRHFSSRIDDKFAEAAWSPGSSGAPLIEGCLAHLECEAHQQVEAGDHTIMIARVRNVSRFEGDPLLFTQGQYSIADAHPDMVPMSEAAGPAAARWFDDTIISQIFEAHHLMSSIFEDHRRAEGMDVPTARVLACLDDTPDIPIDEVVRATFLGRRDAEDAVAALVERRQVAREPDGRLALTPSGRQAREAVRARWRTFQRQQLASLPEADVRAAARTLSKLNDQNRTMGR